MDYQKPKDSGLDTQDSGHGTSLGSRSPDETHSISPTQPHAYSDSRSRSSSPEFPKSNPTKNLCSSQLSNALTSSTLGGSQITQSQHDDDVASAISDDLEDEEIKQLESSLRSMNEARRKKFEKYKEEKEKEKNKK